MAADLYRRVSASSAILQLTVLILLIFGQSLQAQTFSVLYSFVGPPSDGEEPYGGLAVDALGNIYGTTELGGNCTTYRGCGTVFKVDPTGAETVLYSFSGGVDGDGPIAGVILDPSGNVYGTTVGGGTANNGTVFTVDVTGAETVLYNFSGGADGGSPYGGLVRDSNGNLYGTTSSGGVYDRGTVYKVDTSGVETVLYSFAGGLDGSNPYAGVVLDSKGNVYGTTPIGGGGGQGCGPNGCGTVFRVSPTGTETVLHRFSMRSGDGIVPYAGLIRDGGGNLYGTASQGGLYGKGTVFKINARAREVTLYNFVGGTDGEFPYGKLVSGGSGLLYGTTTAGGAGCSSVDGCGTVFQVTMTGQESLLHSLSGASDGSIPFAGLARDSVGNLFGSDIEGGDLNCEPEYPGCGVVFKVVP